MLGLLQNPNIVFVLFWIFGLVEDTWRIVVLLGVRLNDTWSVVVLGVNVNVDVLVEEIGEGAADSDVAGFALGFEGGGGGGGEGFVFGGGEGFGAAEFGEGRWPEEGFKGGGGGGGFPG